MWSVTVCGLRIAELPPQPILDGSQSSCDGGCIGGIAGGCFVLVLVCTGWLSGDFAKTGCPPPSKKLSRVLSRHKTEDGSITPYTRIAHGAIAPTLNTV